MHEETVYDQQIWVCCVVPETLIVGPIVIDVTANTEVYYGLYKQLCAQITEHKRYNCWLL